MALHMDLWFLSELSISYCNIVYLYLGWGICYAAGISKAPTSKYTLTHSITHSQYMRTVSPRWMRLLQIFYLSLVLSLSYAHTWSHLMSITNPKLKYIWWNVFHTIGAQKNSTSLLQHFMNLRKHCLWFYMKHRPLHPLSRCFRRCHCTRNKHLNENLR